MPSCGLLRTDIFPIPLDRRPVHPGGRPGRPVRSELLREDVSSRGCRRPNHLSRFVPCQSLRGRGALRAGLDDVRPSAASMVDSRTRGCTSHCYAARYCKPGVLGGPPEYPRSWLDDDSRATLKDANLDHAKATLADAGDVGSTEDRGVLSRSVFDPAAV
jgi:hypothetical protein